jgi:hypothetical protein
VELVVLLVQQAALVVLDGLAELQAQTELVEHKLTLHFCNMVSQAAEVVAALE